jgi:hypothetical protein
MGNDYGVFDAKPPYLTWNETTQSVHQKTEPCMRLTKLYCTTIFTNTL